MNPDDPTSLDRLHDILVPEPAPWWPPAPGWYWLLGILALAATAALVAGVIRWQQNCYRREALAELARLEAAGSHSVATSLLADLSDLLKRTALTAFPRRDVAALTGPEWFAFLDRTGGTHFAEGLGCDLEAAIYDASGPAWDAARFNALIRETRTWIRAHRAPARETEVPGGEPEEATDARKAA